MVHKNVLGKGLASLLSGPTLLNEELRENTVVPVLETSSQNPGVSSQASLGVSDTPSANLSQVVSPKEESNRDRHLGISMALLDDIHTNYYQPRRDFDEKTLQELSQSIKTNGIIQPLVVKKKDKKGYELIAGERRLKAARLAGLKQVPIVIRRVTERETLEIALIENIQRQNLNCVDEALAYQRLMEDFSLTQELVAERVGKERVSVANHLRLLKLPEMILNDLRQSVLSLGHGKALLSLNTADQRIAVRNQIIEKKLSVRETEAFIDSIHKNRHQSSGQQNAEKDFYQKQGVLTQLRERFLNASQQLGRHWSTRVDIQGNQKKGKVVIHYFSQQDLDRILKALESKQTN